MHLCIASGEGGLKQLWVESRRLVLGSGQVKFPQGEQL